MKSVASIIALSALFIGLFPVPAASIGYNLPVCSVNVHARYTTVGPDGVTYPSWHPQIDNEKNCHFDHEHGSSPASFGLVTWPYGSSVVPAYGYTAARHGSTEGHAGFKTYVFRLSGHTWMVTHHFGSSSPQVAACARFHTVDIVVADGAGVVKADLHMMADFGAAQNVDTGVNLTPTACPTQGSDAQAAGSDGVRKFPVTTSGTAYEPWRMDAHELPAIGFRSGSLTFNTPDQQKACNAMVCDSGVTMLTLGEPARGSFRFLTFNDGGGRGDFRISGAVTGTFYTDPMGMTSLPAGDPHAVRQFVAPGFSVTIPAQPGHLRAGTSEGMYWVSSNANPPNESAMMTNRLVTGPN